MGYRVARIGVGLVISVSLIFAMTVPSNSTCAAGDATCEVTSANDIFPPGGRTDLGRRPSEQTTSGSGWSKNSHKVGEFLLDTALVYVPAAGHQHDPSIASDGSDCLVVWEDERGGSSYDIYCARVDQSGAVLDPTGTAISTAAHDQRYPSVAFDGTNYLVVWSNDRDGLDYDICGARVSSSGVLIDTTAVTISSEPDDQIYPSVTFDGAAYVVAWQDDRSGQSDIYAARVSQAGLVLDDTGMAISTATGVQRNPSMASDGVNSLIVWHDARSGSDYDIYGSRVDQSLTVLDTAGIPISAAAEYQRYPSVAFNGTNYLVAWRDERSGPSDVWGARVSQAGTVLDASGFAISAATDFQWRPSVTSDGTDCLVVWEDFRSGAADVYGARVNQAGTVLDPTGIPISTSIDDQEYPALAFNGVNFVVVWEDERRVSDSDARGARVSQSGTVLDSPDGIVISTAASDQGNPSVAYDGTNYLVVWHDYRSGSDYDIYATRVDHSGSPLDAGGIAVSTAPNDQRYPKASFDGTNYLVVWEDERPGTDSDIYGARVDPSGIVLDSAGLAIGTTGDDQRYPSVAFDGTNYLVVWGDELLLLASNIYGARVSPAAVVLDASPIPISTATSIQWYPSVAFNGSNYLVVWHDHRGSNSDIYGARVQPSGTVLDTSGIPISTAGDYQRYPSVASDGANFFVVWTDPRGSDHDIYGARVDQSGGVLDPSGIPISRASDDQRYPAIAFHSGYFLVIWEDDREGPDSDIYAAQLNLSGDVVDAFPAFAQVGTHVSPSVAGGAENQVLSACSGWADSVGSHPASAMRTWGKLLPITEDCPCGDCNGDGRITAADATYIVGYIFRAGPGLVCNCDVNVDTRITAADATYIISYLYRAGPPPCNPPLDEFRAGNSFLQGGS